MSLGLGACKSGGDITSAEKAFSQEQYSVAINNYKGAYSSIRDKAKRAEVAFKIGEAMRLNRDFLKAESWYQKAITGGYKDPKVYYELGEVLKMNEKYDEAVVQFETYVKEMPSDPRGNEQITVIKEYLNSQKEPCIRFQVENFKLANTSSNDFAPMLLEKEGLVFASDREDATGKKVFGRLGGSYADLFILNKKITGTSKNKVEKWVTPAAVIAGGINTDYNEATPTFDPKGGVMYYTQCNGVKGDKPNCVIMMAKKKGKEWVPEPEPLPFCTDTTIDYGQPALSPDGTKLIFSMDGPGSVGGKDLYITTYVKRSRTWGDPVNLGPMINTDKDEMFPYFFNDTTLYFSSDGHAGLGGLDIFVSNGMGETWTKPKHLRSPLNSGGDDFGIVYDANGESGYFTSNRVSGRGGDDIYSFANIPPVFTLKGIVRDKDTKKPVGNATVTLLDEKTNKKTTAVTDATGAYMFKLNIATSYTISADKEGYLGSVDEHQTTVGLECNADLVQDLEISRTGFELKGIYYDLDSDSLRPEAKIILDTLVQVLTDYPKLIIELGSHTDCRASAEYNQDLSQRRAQSVINYLVNTKGIPSGRMVAKGYGETQLVNNCQCDRKDNDTGIHCTEEEHQLNRRTTVRVLSFNWRP
ncbi:MAG: hypothetical protein EOP53_09540, partial [Sphingobacteriales bacterium]